MTSQTDTHPLDNQWRGILKTGANAAFAMFGIMIAQIAIYIIWPPPTTVNGFFQLFTQSKFLGLLSLDLLYILNNTLLILFYLGLFATLRKVNFSATIIALLLGIVGITAYFSSNTAFEMLSLANQHATASTESQRAIFMAAGQSMLETYKGTSFDVYYVLNGISLLIFAFVMLRSNVYSRTTSIFGVIAGVLMAIPSTAGVVGLVFSLASLIPWAVFSILVAVQILRQISRSTDITE